MMLKKHFEVVPINVFIALQYWYGGGPVIIREVVCNLNNAGGIFLFCKQLRIYDFLDL
jgi:nicotinamide riboside transporter PnuC